MMKNIRNLIVFYYEFKNIKNSQIKIHRLLNNDAFLTKKIDKKICFDIRRAR